MGFKVNGSPIPDPAVYTGAASALDSEGGRDANGTLHRKMVAMKHPLKMEYHSISYEMMETIMSKMTGESFQFSFPDPADGYITIKAYVGDREWTTAMARGKVDQTREDTDWKGNWFGDLSFSVIEY
jgi:hypothetical protein